jgi:hypothetical protein
MSDQPDAKSLIEIARATLNAEVLPLLPADRRLAGLMVANALGIAARDLAAPTALAPNPSIAGIRSGRHDGDKILYDALLADARQRVAASNPKYLADDDSGMSRT